MKEFKCWILTEYGWICFIKEFESEEEAYKYCEGKSDCKNTSIVEEING